MKSLKLSGLRRTAGLFASWTMLGAGAVAFADNGVGSWLSPPISRVSGCHSAAAQSTDDIGVAGYIIHRSTDGTLGAEVARTLAAPWIDSLATAGSTYAYAVEAYDVAGNVSLASSPASITVYRAPANVTATLTSGHPQLTWDASADIVDVAGYAIYRSTKGTLGAKVASTTATTWRDPFVQSGVKYTYGIRAYDPAGYASGPSTLVSITAP